MGKIEIVSFHELWLFAEIPKYAKKSARRQSEGSGANRRFGVLALYGHCGLPNAETQTGRYSRT